MQFPTSICILFRPALALAFFVAARALAQDVSREELLGKFQPASHPSFVPVEPVHASRPGMYLRREAYEAFLRMKQAADSSGIRLVILSATRTFDDQKRIWERKWNREKYAGWKDADKSRDILRYSSMPGTSRHHWGTDMDLNSLEPAWFRSGEGKRTFEWLSGNAARFGFCQTYTPRDKGRTGYEEEPWHWSYFPLSAPFLDAYLGQVRAEDIRGFSGDHTAEEIDVIGKYVRGIECSAAEP